MEGTTEVSSDIDTGSVQYIEPVKAQSAGNAEPGRESQIGPSSELIVVGMEEALVPPVEPEGTLELPITNVDLTESQISDGHPESVIETKEVQPMAEVSSNSRASMNDVATNLFSKYLISAEGNARASILLSRGSEAGGGLGETESPETVEAVDATAANADASVEGSDGIVEGGGAVSVPQEVPEELSPPGTSDEVLAEENPSSINMAEERASLKESEYTEGSESEPDTAAAPATAAAPTRRRYSFEDDDLLADADSVDAAALEAAAQAANDLMLNDASQLDLDVNVPPIADMVPSEGEVVGEGEVKPKKSIKKKIKKHKTATATGANNADATAAHSRQHLKTADKKQHPGKEEPQLYPHYSELVTGIYKRPIVISILVAKKAKKTKWSRSGTAPETTASAATATAAAAAAVDRPSSPEQPSSSSRAGAAGFEESGASDTDDPLHRDISSVVSVNENKPGLRGPKFKSFVVKAYDLVESKEAVTTVNLYDYNLLLEDLAIEHQSEVVLDYYNPASLQWWSKHLKKLVRVFVRHTDQLSIIVDRGLIKKRVREKMKYHKWLLESLASAEFQHHQQQHHPQHDQQQHHMEGTETPVKDLPSVTQLEALEALQALDLNDDALEEMLIHERDTMDLKIGESAITEEPSTVQDGVTEQPSLSHYQNNMEGNSSAVHTLHGPSGSTEYDLDLSHNWQPQEQQEQLHSSKEEPPHRPQLVISPLPQEGAIIYENPQDAGLVINTDTENDEENGETEGEEGVHQSGKKRRKKKSKKVRKMKKKDVDPGKRRYKVVSPHPIVVLHNGQYHPKPLQEPVGGWNSDVSHVPRVFSTMPRLDPSSQPQRAASPQLSASRSQGHHSSPSSHLSAGFSGSLISATPWNDNPNINPMKIIPRDPSPPRGFGGKVTMSSTAPIAATAGASAVTVGGKAQKKPRELESLSSSQSTPVLVTNKPVTVPGLPHQSQQQHLLSKSQGDISLAQMAASESHQLNRTAPSSSQGRRAVADDNSGHGSAKKTKKSQRVRPKTMPEQPADLLLKPVTPPVTMLPAFQGSKPKTPSVAQQQLVQAQWQQQQQQQQRSILDDMSQGDSFDGGDGQTTEVDVFNAVQNLMSSLPQLRNSSASTSGKTGSLLQRSIASRGGIENRRGSKLGSVISAAGLEGKRSPTRLPSISANNFTMPPTMSTTALTLLETEENPETAEVASKSQAKALEIIKGVRASFTATPSYKYQRMSFQEIKLLDSPFAKKIYYSPEETEKMNAAHDRAIKAAIAANSTSTATTAAGGGGGVSAKR